MGFEVKTATNKTLDRTTIHLFLDILNSTCRIGSTHGGAAMWLLSDFNRKSLKNSFVTTTES